MYSYVYFESNTDLNIYFWFTWTECILHIYYFLKHYIWYSPRAKHAANTTQYFGVIMEPIKENTFEN